MWDQAIADGRRALQIRERNYGPDDPRVATTLNNLSLALRGAGEFEEAAAMGERVLELREQILGPDHPRTTTAINNLGLVYKKMGRLDRAEELYLRALEIRTRTLGELHPRVGTIYNNLAGVYFERGDLDLAEGTYRQGARDHRGHPRTRSPRRGPSPSGLSLVANARGRHAEVERLSLRDLAIREAVAGAEKSEPRQGLCGRSERAGSPSASSMRRRRTSNRARTIAVAAYGENSEQTAEVDEVLAEVEKARSDAEH